MKIEGADYLGISHQFADELSAASQGKESSLPFIRNPLPERPLVHQGEIFQAFVIGGTNGSVATGTLDANGRLIILNQEKVEPLPQFVTKDDFLDFIRSRLDPNTKAIGINFAYNLIPVVGEHGELDGTMNQGDTKGHAFAGLQGEKVGETIAADIKAKLQRDNMIVSVANDTVCLLAAGIEEGIDRAEMVASIAGTGYNDAIFIDEHTIVNLQASDFKGFQQTVTGRKVDENSNNPGEQLYNKEVAAGDLYKHFNQLNAQLNLNEPPLESSVGLSALAKIDNSPASEVARELLRRSAHFIAAHLAGIYKYKNNPKHLFCIMQGSLFLKEPGYLADVQQELEALGVPSGTIEFKEIENSDIFGAFKLLTG